MNTTQGKPLTECGTQDPEVIYLEPACCADTGPGGVGRTWAEDQPWEKCEDGDVPTKYIRADLADITRAEAQPQDETQARINRAYSERAYCAAALARMALANGYKAGTGLDSSENDPEWRVVLYVDTPNGQVSWHVSPNDQWVLEGLPEYGAEWDGTFKSREGKFAVWPAPTITTPTAESAAWQVAKATAEGLSDAEFEAVRTIIQRTIHAAKPTQQDGLRVTGFWGNPNRLVLSDGRSCTITPKLLNEYGKFIAAPVAQPEVEVR